MVTQVEIVHRPPGVPGCTVEIDLRIIAVGRLVIRIVIGAAGIGNRGHGVLIGDATGQQDRHQNHQNLPVNLLFHRIQPEIPGPPADDFN
jgi:hypothetical protein